MSGQVEDEIDREALELQAEQVRARLLRRIDVLEKRRHEVLDVKRQVESHIVPIAAGGVVVVASAGAALALAIHHAVESRKHRGRERVRAFRLLWEHPERATRLKRGSIFGEVGRKALIAGLSLIAVELTKRGVKQLVAPMRAEPTSGVMVTTLPAEAVRG